MQKNIRFPILQRACSPPPLYCFFVTSVTNTIHLCLASFNLDILVLSFDLTQKYVVHITFHQIKFVSLFINVIGSQMISIKKSFSRKFGNQN